MEQTHKRNGSHVMKTAKSALHKKKSDGSNSVGATTIKGRESLGTSKGNRPAKSQLVDHANSNISGTSNDISFSRSSEPWNRLTNVLPSHAPHLTCTEEMKEILADDFTEWFREMFANIYERPASNLFPSQSHGNICLESNIHGNRSETEGMREAKEDSPLNLLVKALPYSRCQLNSNDSSDTIRNLPQKPRQKSNPSRKSQQSSESGSDADRAETFPMKLHKLLADLEAREGGQEIASFLPNGWAFRVNKPRAFEGIMKDYFHMSMFPSFQRQLLLYKFKRIKKGKDKGAYFHDLFQNGNPNMSTYMRPMKTLRRSQTNEKKCPPSSKKAK
jgi:hypothetical protein